VAGEIPLLRELIEASVRRLQEEDYTPAQMEGALESVFGVDSQLIADGTYLVAEARIVDEESDVAKAGERKISGSVWVLAGCGGWSKRKTLYGSDRWSGREDTLLDPKRDAGEDSSVFHTSGVGATRHWKQDTRSL